MIAAQRSPCRDALPKRVFSGVSIDFSFLSNKSPKSRQKVAKNYYLCTANKKQYIWQQLFLYLQKTDSVTY